MAFFHPSFAWAETESDDPLNFEKRSPFPTINLLRGAAIKKYDDENNKKRKKALAASTAAKDLTGTIQEMNAAALERKGTEYLRNKLEEIIKIALD